MNFRAEAKTETSIVLSWSPPRQEIIVKYELLYKEGDHSKEVSPEQSRVGAEELPGPAVPALSERGEQGRCLWAGLTSAARCLGLFSSSPLAPVPGAEELRAHDLVHGGRPEAQH